MNDETAAVAPDEIPVRFEAMGKTLDLAQVNRAARRLLEAQASKFRKKYADVVGPNGERPTVVIRSARMLDRNIQVVLEYPESMKDSVKGHEKADRIS